MAVSILSRYKSAKIRHPSWRIYKALDIIKNNIEDIKNKNIFDNDDLDSLSPKIFGLRDGIEVYYPKEEADDLTNEIVAAIIDPEYSDRGKFCIDDCMFIFCDIDGRQLLEGMLMEDYSLNDISLELNIPIETIEAYSITFFDTSIWRTPGDKDHYIAKGTIGLDGQRKSEINKYGLDYVATNSYHRQSKIKMEKALANLFGKTYTQIMANIGETDPNEAERVQKMTSNLINMFKELRNSNKGDGGIKELAIALKTLPAPNKGVDNLT